MPAPGYLSIPNKQWYKMKTHLASFFPQEACGLMAGQGCEIRFIIPVANRLQSNHAYFMDPVELLAGLKEIDSLGLEFVGVYHSHPAGPAEPSLKDRIEAISPDVVYVICAPDRSDIGKADPIDQSTAIVWQVRGFLIYRDQTSEIEIRVG